MKTNIIAASVIVSLCVGFGFAHAAKHTHATSWVQNNTHATSWVQNNAASPQNNSLESRNVSTLKESVSAVSSLAVREGFSEPKPLSPDVKVNVNVPEITIVGYVHSHKSVTVQETDADHIARLMSAPIVCGPMTDNWVGGRSANCRLTF